MLTTKTLLTHQRDCRACHGSGHEPDPRAIGKELRRAREERMTSLRSVARELGVTAPYVVDLELGRRKWNEELVGRYLMAMERAAVLAASKRGGGQ